MNRRIALGIIGGFVAGVMATTGLVAAATPSDSCESAYTAPMNSTQKLKAYEDCRFDRLDAAVKALDSTSPEPSATPSASPSTSETPAASPSPSGTPTPSETPSASQTPTVTPSATPTPSATATTPAGFPDESTTGVPSGTTLKRVPEDIKSGTGWAYDSRGWIAVNGSGAVLDGIQTRLNIDVTASNVTIRNSELTAGQGGWGITLRRAKNVTIANNTLKGVSASNPGDNAIRDIYGDSDGVKITGNDIHWWGSGINHFNSGGLIEGNFIHELKNDATGNQHLNGIQLGAGTGSLMTIRGNTILNPDSQTDAIMLANDDGAQKNRTIEGNLIGGGGYTFYGAGGPNGTATGITFRNNQFTTRYYAKSGYWGPVAYWKSGNVWTNNTYADGPNAGKPVTP